MRLLWTLLVLMLAIMAVPVFAQPDVPVPISGEAWYASSFGIAAATVLLVAGLKRAIGTVEPFASLPTWIYAIIVSAVLVLVARSVYHTMPGPIVQVLFEVVKDAAIASGARSWFMAENVTKTLRASAATVRPMVKKGPTV